MNYWNRFLQEENFTLAWRRVNTGQNIYYKRFFREVFLAYEIALEKNIRCLISRIKGMSYKPSPPDRIFIPKPSGLQRPITLLTIEDQLVWQAIANILALKWQEERSKLERKVVFSNLSNPNKIFFFENWKISYRVFRERISQVYKENKWVAHFDLAAYFDTISHDHIIKLISPRNADSEIAVLIKKGLNCWTSEKCSRTFSHGIPQGPIASSYIGELIFLDIDKIIAKEESKFIYLRYVDDIRVFAKNEDSAREGVIKLEEICRNKGLIPQSSKTGLFYAKDEEEALGKNFSFTPEWYIDEKADKIFVESVNLEKNEIIDLTKFKLFLFKGPILMKYLEVILKLFEKSPNLSDAFVNYLAKFENEDKVVSFLTSLLQRKKFPYQYVEGNVWLLLSVIDRERKSKNLTFKACRKILNPRNNFYLRYGLLMYLAPFVKDASKRVFNKYFYEHSSLMQSLVLPNIASEFPIEEYLKILKRCLVRSSPDAGLVAATRMAYDNIDYKELQVEKKIKPVVRNCLIALGIVKSRTIPVVTPFEELIFNRYNIVVNNWKSKLGREYTHAYRILIMSEKAFDINKSAWLCLVDSFNEIITRALISSDKTVNVPLTDANSKLVKFGCLLDSSNDFCRKYTVISDIFRILHKRRCSVPEAHPYDEKTTKRAKPLSVGERNNFYGKLKKAYPEVDVAFQNL